MPAQRHSQILPLDKIIFNPIIRKCLLLEPCSKALRMPERNNPTGKENFRVPQQDQSLGKAPQPNKDAIPQRKRVIRGDELARLRDEYPGIGGNADYVLSWTTARGTPAYSTMKEPQPDGSYRVVGIHELRPEHVRIPTEDL